MAGGSLVTRPPVFRDVQSEIQKTIQGQGVGLVVEDFQEMAIWPTRVMKDRLDSPDRTIRLTLPVVNLARIGGPASIGTEKL